jgi:hypothetical protein
MPAIRTALVALVALALALAAAGCSGDDASEAGEPAPATTTQTAPAPPATAPEPAPEPEPAPAPLPGLPDDVAGFDSWTRLNAEPIPQDSPQAQRVGFDAHGGVKDVYVNRPRAAVAGAEGRTFPDGAIVVKAAREDGAITLVAIMRKVAGSDPAHGDWEFVEYKRDGAGDPFATDASLAGATCWGCHATASGSDWVFTPTDPE